jgi:hypothetical protein
MPVLTREQYAELVAIFVDGDEFNTNTMGWVVRSALGPRLDMIAGLNQRFDVIVAAVLDWAEQRGKGTIEALLHGAMKARPSYAKLRRFCEEHFPGALQRHGAGALVHTFNLGLTVLIDMRDEPLVRQTVGGFRADFEATGRQIRILKKYKGVHDSLHDLQLALPKITGDLVRSTKDATAVRGFGRYVIDLRRIAKAARSHIEDLPGRGVEELWIDEFDGYINQIEDAGRPTATAADRANLGEVCDWLRALLTHASRINTAVANAADALRFDSFVKTMDTVAKQMSPMTAPEDPALRQLVASSTAVGLLQSRLAGKVGEHFEWQILNTQLDGAENSPKHQPQARMRLWSQFRDKLTGLCDIFPDEDWSRDLRKLMLDWIEATPSAQPGDDEREAGDNAFATFRHACVYRFFDVDKELNELAGQVTEVAMPLDTLLTAIQ